MEKEWVDHLENTMKYTETQTNQELDKIQELIENVLENIKKARNSNIPISSKIEAIIGYLNNLNFDYRLLVHYAMDYEFTYGRIYDYKNKKQEEK